VEVELKPQCSSEATTNFDSLDHRRSLQSLEAVTATTHKTRAFPDGFDETFSATFNIQGKLEAWNNGKPSLF